MDDDPRERLRREAAAAPGAASPWLHLGTTVMTGAALIAAGASQLRDVRAWQVGFAALVAVFANACEWHLHRDSMHARRRWARALHRSHTEVHHRVYRSDDMALRRPGELRLVLLKPWALLAFALLASPATLGLWWIGQHNLAALLLLVGSGYVLAYELLHLAYHLPTGPGPLGSALRRLGRHHRRHHDADRPTTVNFNVTVPLWDLVRGTRASVDITDGRNDG